MNTSVCDHCGEVCDAELTIFKDHVFCCNGCKQVFQLLQDNGLGNYYLYQSTPGSTIIDKKKELFSYLDEAEIKDQLLDFTNDELSKVTFKISNI
ncbi:MAG: hypothetical protein GY786_01970, partial [Proteobacteria bacterium]|nr:hypothetical protein [Pseudomonadota bacterium]